MRLPHASHHAPRMLPTGARAEKATQHHKYHPLHLALPVVEHPLQKSQTLPMPIPALARKPQQKIHPQRELFLRHLRTHPYQCQRRQPQKAPPSRMQPCGLHRASKMRLLLSSAEASWNVERRAASRNTRSRSTLEPRPLACPRCLPSTPRSLTEVVMHPTRPICHACEARSFTAAPNQKIPSPSKSRPNDSPASEIERPRPTLSQASHLLNPRASPLRPPRTPQSLLCPLPRKVPQRRA